MTKKRVNDIIFRGINFLALHRVNYRSTDIVKYITKKKKMTKNYSFYIFLFLRMSSCVRNLAC